MKKIIIITSFCFFSFHCFAATNSPTSQLQSSAGAVSSNSISANVSSEQARQNSKLSVQLKIDALRAKLGGVTDIETKIQLENELKLLQEQRQKL